MSRQDIEFRKYHRKMLTKASRLHLALPSEQTARDIMKHYEALKSRNERGIGGPETVESIARRWSI